MALADYKADSREFTYKGGSFTVKGLSLTAFTKLVRHHLADVEAVWELIERVMGGSVDLTEEKFTQVIVALLEEAPGFCTNVIVLASGEEGKAAEDAAASLPFPVQLEVLTGISKLTFDEVGGIKKAWEIIAGLLKTNPLPKKTKAETTPQ